VKTEQVNKGIPSMKINFPIFFLRRAVLVFFAVFLSAAFAYAQTTGITYQGRLTDASGASSGTYLFEFRLYDSASNGILIDTLTGVSATVADGIFTVELNFTAANAFDGGERYLEIAVKRSNDPPETAYTTLTPRQRVTSAPYAIRAKNPAPGTDGLNALINLTAEQSGANCAAGGSKVETGLDANRNGTLEAGEVNAAQTRYICNGAAPSFYTRQSPTQSVPGNAVDHIRNISCFTGDMAIGGGFSTNNNIKVYKSAPLDSDTWEVVVSNPTNQLFGLSVFVVCADLTP
jgi:hypothetical protein